MSLFKAKDWWSLVVEGDGGYPEQCDIGSMIIANIDNQDPPQDKIIVAGFSGVLRIFAPQVSNSYGDI